MMPDRVLSARVITTAAIAAGSIGVVLAVANVTSPFRAPLVLLFLAVAPAAAVFPLLGRFDRLARLVIAGAASVTVNFLVAESMLAAGLWSPRGGIVAVTVLTAACAVAELAPVRARLARKRGRPGRVTAAGAERRPGA